MDRLTDVDYLSRCLTIADACAVAYLLLCEDMDRAAELRYEAHMTALFMGGEGDPPNLPEMKREGREVLDRALSSDNDSSITPEQRVLREALGLKV